MVQWWECSPPTNVVRVRFRPGVICGLSSLLVLALLRRCFSGFSGFPPFTKNDISKFYSTRIGDSLDNQLRLTWLSKCCNLFIYLFIYLFIFISLKLLKENYPPKLTFWALSFSQSNLINTSIKLQLVILCGTIKTFSYTFLSSLCTERKLDLLLSHSTLYIFLKDLFLWRPCEKKGVKVH